MKMMKYSLAIFDLDGTILNTLDDLCDSVNFALSAHLMPARTIEEVREFVGNGIMMLIERAVPENTDELTIQRVYQTFCEHYRNNSANKTRPYEGIAELLCTLRKNGMKLAVLSNKADFAVTELCKVYFEGLFDYAVGERQGVPRKPAPDAVYSILQHFEAQKSQAVYIGDSDVDFKTADNAGLDRILVSWGFRKREILEALGAEKIADNTSELLKYLI